MPTVTVQTEISAPIELCFDLARDIDLHCRTAAFTSEKVVGGKTSGLLGLDDTVTFEGVHFGIRQRLTSRIVEFDRPRRFVDEMVSGPFRSLRHIHEFERSGGVVLMTDTLLWSSPLGPLGLVADLFIKPHLSSFVNRRNAALKRIAEEQAGNQRSS